MRGKSFFDQSLVSGRQPRIIQVKTATNQQLPLAQSKQWQFLQDFRETHAEI